MKRNEKGFDLIELLIITVVILLVAVIAIPDAERARPSPDEPVRIVQPVSYGEGVFCFDIDIASDTDETWPRSLTHFLQNHKSLRVTAIGSCRERAYSKTSSVLIVTEER